MSSSSGISRQRGSRSVTAVVATGSTEVGGINRDPFCFEALFEHALDAFVVLNPVGQFIDANQTACQLCGLSKSELIGRNVAETIETTKDFESAWSKFLREKTYRGQRWLVRPDGERRLIEIRATTDVLPGCHFAIWRDITDRYFLEDDLAQREQDQTIARLAGSIAHDFTNLLHVIGGHTELLARQIPTNSKSQGHIDRILASTKQGAIWPPNCLLTADSKSWRRPYSI